MKLLKDIKYVFVTGGAGFIGSHIVDSLIEGGKDVIVYDNFSSGKKSFLKKSLNNSHLKIVKGDLLDKKRLHRSIPKNTDLVIHLAANPDISKGIVDPTLDFNQTIIATFNLLLEMKRKDIQKMVFFSGSGVYGDVGNQYTPEEFGPLLPVSMYGASKLSAEALISAFSHLFAIQVWIFRPANIVGDRATHGVVFDFIHKLQKNPKELKILGDGKQSKSYLYISDVLDALFLGLSKTNDHINLFNIASTTFVTVNEIADIVISEMKLKNVKIKRTGGRVGWPGDVPIVRIENKKLEKLGWKATFTSNEAIKQTVIDLLEQSA